MSSSSSRDNWERLVAAVLKREQIWQLCHQNSISTISSEDSGDQRTLHLSSNSLASLSVSPYSPIPLETPPASQEHLRIHLGRLRRFSLQELQVATDNFGVKNVLDYNRMIYKGRIADGSLVAVKRYKHRVVEDAKKCFLLEVEIDSLTAHPNVLHVIGFCVTPKEWLLVYPFMANGSVASQLIGRPGSPPPLNWPTRVGIALGVAKGLAHLHEECDKKILHRDIKTANIWLNEDIEAVVAGVELGIVVEHNASYVDVAVRGPVGHIAPEYLSTGTCSEKSDVFGYGGFLLELITGQRAFDLARLANDEGVMLLDWVKKIYLEREWKKLVGEDFGGDYLKEVVVEELVQLALICTQITPQGRPRMSEVVGMLEDGDSLKEKWEEWQKNEAVIKKLDSTSIMMILSEFRDDASAQTDAVSSIASPSR